MGQELIAGYLDPYTTLGQVSAHPNKAMNGVKSLQWIGKISYRLGHRAIPMADLQLEDLVRGVATGEYVRKVGSQFGSIWGFDGLMLIEATPEQYAAFGASGSTKLGHGQPLQWLGHEWRVILAYHRGELRQVNIHTDPDDATFAKVREWLENILGKGQEATSAQDVLLSVHRRVMWKCRDGVVTLVSTPTFLQMSVGQPVEPSVLLSATLGPVIALPVGAVLWLLMVAVKLAPMTWPGFLFNWLLVTIIWEAWIICGRAR